MSGAQGAAERLLGKQRAMRTELIIRRLRTAAWAQGATLDVRTIGPVRIVSMPRLVVERGTTTTIELGAGTVLQHDVLLQLRGGHLRLGADVDVRDGVGFNIGGRCTVGDGVVLSHGLRIHCAEAVGIGDWTIIGEYSTIVDSKHLRTGPDEPIHHASEAAPVHIGRNVWVGAKATIARGVSVGDQAIIGAHALVTRDVPASTLVGSPPATEVRRLES